MTEQFDDRKARASGWFRSLRDEIVAAFESLEDTQTAGPTADLAAGRFEVSETKRRSEDGSDAGGGLMSVMRGGRGWPRTRGSGRAGSAWLRICRTRMCRPFT